MLDRAVESLTRPSLRLLLILCLVVSNVLVLVLSGYFLYQSRQEYELRAQTLTQTVANAVDQSLSSNIEKINLALHLAADDLERLLSGNGYDEQAMTAHLARHEQLLPQIEAIRVTNADGLVILGKGLDKKNPTSWADRDFFIHLRDRADGALQISNPRIEPGTERYFVIFSRRFNHPDGRFAGVIAAPITLDYFAQTLARFDLGPADAIALRDSELGLIARSPPIADQPGGQVGDSNVSSELRQLVKSGVPTATYDCRVNSDGVKRTITFRRLDKAPIVVLVGLARDDYLTNWRNEVWQTATMDFGFLLLSLLVGRLLLRLLTQAGARERMLRHSEERLKNAQRVAQIGSWHLDLARNEIEWSDETYRIFGIAAGTRLGYGDFLATVHKDDRAAVNTAWRLALKGKHFDITHRILVGNEVKWVHEQAVLGYDAQGQAESGSGTAQDVTQQVLARQALAKSETRFQATFEQAAMGIAMVSTEGRWLQVNRRLCEIVGYSHAELMERTFQGITYKDDLKESVATVQRMLSGEIQHYANEKRYVRKDGSLVWIKATAAMVRNTDGSPDFLIAVIEDIQARKQAQSELEQHQQQLEVLVQERTAELSAARHQAETANHSKSRFLAAASHDLRQPLAALSLYVGVLKNRVAPDQAELIGSIQQCVDSLSGLLSDLLDVSKLDAGVVTPTLSDFAVDELLNILYSFHSAAARQKGLRLRMRLSGAFARSDLQLLIRVAGNLVHNAIRYTNHGGVLIACRHHQGKRWLEVWDTGIGIPENKTEVVFEEFRQLGDDARSRGSGLGLAIVDKTAKLLGLRIRLRSQPGRGSMFAVELPPGRAPVAAGVSPPAPASRFLRVGLVEDNTYVLQALTLAMENVGHEVLAATSSRDLLELLGETGPDIIISDYRLTAMETGFDVIEAVRQVFGDELPALLITGDTDPGLIRSMADQGIAVHYKPLQMEMLLLFISEATERRSSK